MHEIKPIMTNFSFIIMGLGWRRLALYQIGISIVLDYICINTFNQLNVVIADIPDGFAYRMPSKIIGRCGRFVREFYCSC